jgi:regulator of protease activity HflC (stomatin/prohibitin superfamily)
MRVDHLAFQRAANISVFGFFLQLLVALTFLIYGLAVADSPSIMASLWAFPSLLIWIGLILVFNQHKLERLESLEEDELSSGGVVGDSIFDRSGDEIRVAARRVKLLYRWILPVLSILYVASLGILSWRMLIWLSSLGDLGSIKNLPMTDGKGWLVAICLGFTAACFICSRFLSGMAELKAWQNLRAGAGAMVGNSLVLLAVAIGVIFRFFEVDNVLEVVAWSIPIFMLVAAAEVLLNLILNIYRPRTHGDHARPAFDSRALSLLAQPDSLVRSANEAVNYQFGFDISSSWGYQLVLRSGGWLIVLGAVALVGLSTMVVVDGRQEGLRIRHGAIIGNDGTEVHDPGLFWKLPWPLETSELHEVTVERVLAINGQELKTPMSSIWGKDELKLVPGDLMLPFIVSGSRMGEGNMGLMRGLMEATGSDDSIESDSETNQWDIVNALVDMQIYLTYRIRPSNDDDGGGLLEYLAFGSDRRSSRQSLLTERETALKLMALSQTTQYLGTLGLDDVLSLDRSKLAAELFPKIRSALDEMGTGIDLLGVDIPVVRPVGSIANSFEDLDIAIQQSDSLIAEAERNRVVMLTSMVGNPDLVTTVLDAIGKVEEAQSKYDVALEAHGEASEQATSASLEVDRLTMEASKLVRRGGGRASRLIATAERDHWVSLMDQRTQASRIRGQGAAYRAAPELYRQWHTMQSYRNFPGFRKYIIGIAPDRMKVNVGLNEYASPGTIYSDTVLTEEEE